MVEQHHPALLHMQTAKEALAALPIKFESKYVVEQYTRGGVPNFPLAKEYEVQCSDMLYEQAVTAQDSVVVLTMICYPQLGASYRGSRQVRRLWLSLADVTAVLLWRRHLTCFSGCPLSQGQHCKHR